MPRGGSGKGGHNNFLTATTATAAEISGMNAYALDLASINPPDLHDADDIERAAIEYFTICQKHGIRPGNLALYAAWGMTRQDVESVLSQRNKSKVSPAGIDVIKKWKRTLSAIREAYANESKVHPATYIFQAKNFDGLEDQTRIQVSSDNAGPVTISADEARAALEDMPIDVEYSEKEDNCT